MAATLTLHHPDWKNLFYAIPLEHKPSWRNPPWMTLLLIIVNMLVFWGPQRSERLVQQKAADFYFSSPLPMLELPLFVAWLEETNSRNARVAQTMLKTKRGQELLEGMEQEPAFIAKLHTDTLITPAHELYAEWKQARKQYESLQPAPFTQNWAQNYAKDAEFRPETWLSTAFLHSSTSHLLGNMLFLFLFGFTVELALGRTTFLAFYLLGAVGASLLAGWAYAGKDGYGLGASGAVSALMGMYAVMYRLRRIRFFYQLFFYFNYVTAPALILLPVWIANELLQQATSGKNVAYMAHLGGLLTGALLMTGALYFRKLAIPVTAAAAAVAATDEDGEPVPDFEHHANAAKRLTSETKFEAACAQWRAAASLRPTDADTLRAWFNMAKLWPAGDDFHQAAHRIFRLPGYDTSTLELQYNTYLIYLDIAKPGARLKADDMVRLVSRFVRGRHFKDAEKLCHALLKTAPAHPALADTLCICANGLLHSGQRERALAFLPQLQRLAPNEMVTRLLEKG